MFCKKIKALLASGVFFLLSFNAFCDPFFTGMAGGKLKVDSDQSVSFFSPELTLQAFFAGQINLTNNIWSHIEFSLDTKNLVSSTLFDKTPATFQLDELSLIFRQNIESLSNYFSVFMGTYDPVGSDIFLQRQFGINPITSKITESWLGMAGSLLYPHFGAGISDVIRFGNPVAAGIYAYVNHEDADYYVFNFDVRGGGTSRYFTWDFALGLGAPLATNKYSNVLLAVEKLYWHAGTTMLIGNNFTNALFIQAGLYNASFRPDSGTTSFNIDDMYLLVEPRLTNKLSKIHISIYSFPQKTVNKLLFVYDQFGVNVNVFKDTYNTENHTINFGMHTSVSFPNASITTLNNIPTAFITGDYNIHLTPYITAKVFNGDLNAMVSLNIMDFTRDTWFHALDINIGFKTSF